MSPTAQIGVTAQSQQTPTAAALATAAAVLHGFGLRALPNLQAAQEEAGYHLLRPSDPAYAIDATALRAQQRYARPLSVSEYSSAAIAPDSIEVDIGPEYFWQMGALTDGKEERVGGREGFMLSDQHSYVLAFGCGLVDNVPVWCKVTAPARMPFAVFAEFVASLT